ncbi:MAG: hypothetical protein V8R91_19220 [Butyricimonas faecihominis]
MVFGNTLTSRGIATICHSRGVNVTPSFVCTLKRTFASVRVNGMSIVLFWFAINSAPLFHPAHQKLDSSLDVFSLHVRCQCQQIGFRGDGIQLRVVQVVNRRVDVRDNSYGLAVPGGNVLRHLPVV